MDEHRINEVKKGNKEALAQLLHDNYEIVYKYMIKFTFNVNVAEDMVQETMVRAIEKIELYQPERAKFSTWLISIAQNIYIDNLRRQKREQKYIEEDTFWEELEKLPVPEDDSWEGILEALASLSEEIRAPIIMKHYYGYAYEEIAVMMAIPLGTVKSRIHNGLKSLRKELAV